MKRFALAAVVVTLATLPSWADEKPFTSKDGKFTVKFLSAPKTEVKEEGGQKQYYFTDLNMDKGIFFLALYADFPDKEIAGKKPKELISDFVTGLAGGFKGKVESEKDITLGANKIPGREVFIKSPQGTAMVGRVFVDGRRIYLVATAGTEDSAKGADSKGFLDSFQLTK